MSMDQAAISMDDAAISLDDTAMDDLVRNEADLLRLAGRANRSELLDAIRADAALHVEDDGWDDGGFLLFIGDSVGVGFEMTFPFTIAEFWAGLEQVAGTARSYLP